MKYNEIYLEDEHGNTSTMTSEEAFKLYMCEIMYSIQKPNGIINYSDFVRYYTHCAEALKNHIPLGITVRLEIDNLREPGVIHLRVTAQKQNWFRMTLAKIGLFFMYLSRQKIEIGD
jgi:hypothetical protein